MNNTRACTSLAQAVALAQAKETLRSSYRLSLRRDYHKKELQVSRTLTWASSHRLSETTLCPKERLPRLSCFWSETHQVPTGSRFAWVRWFIPQNESSPPEWELEQQPGPVYDILAEARQVRLGEIISSRHGFTHTNHIQTRSTCHAFLRPSTTPHKYLGRQNSPTKGKIT